VNEEMQEQVLIFGATGNMGGAATQALLQAGWRVRAVTRNPKSDKALALAALGAELCQADTDNRASLNAAFDGIKRVFSVQNWGTSGVDGEIRQGKLVADVAKAARVEHLVYGSAGISKAGTGVPHFECKLEVEGYMRRLNLPFSVVRPAPFMELLSKKEFFPALGFWGAGPKVLGWDLPIPWVAVRDIGQAIANIFADGNAWVEREIELYGDVRSLREARQLFLDVTGKKPFRIPLPLALFNKMAGEEFTLMWRWMVDWIGERGPQILWQRVEAARMLCPDMLDMTGWLKLSQNEADP
jgi:uncharacterized protein YbjT (DUF2867 family)